MVQQVSRHHDDVGRGEDRGARDRALAGEEVDNALQRVLSPCPGLLQPHAGDVLADEPDRVCADAGEQRGQSQYGFAVQLEGPAVEFLGERLDRRQALGPAGRDRAVHEVALGQPPAALVDPGEDLRDLLVVVGLHRGDRHGVLADPVHPFDPVVEEVVVGVSVRHPGLAQNLPELW